MDHRGESILIQRLIQKDGLIRFVGSDRVLCYFIIFMSFMVKSVSCLFPQSKPTCLYYNRVNILFEAGPIKIKEASTDSVSSSYETGKK